ncbi:hypothetical protein KSP40_PGU001133 [Platanthera guangdongensis]|uniref:Uncharacterized protein n=1 Tax=Platanthera guangdongensis TaxID=2320717 RepID=A0ABR2MV50_9ASPA
MNQNNVINASEHQHRPLHYITKHEPVVEYGTTKITAITTNQGGYPAIGVAVMPFVGG